MKLHNVKHLERTLITSVILGETTVSNDKFKEVGFLQDKDFQCYQSLWPLVKGFKGDLFRMLQSLPEEYQDSVLRTTNYTRCDNVQYLAVKLVEMRLERLLSSLLGNLSETTKNPLESDLLIKAKSLVGVRDLFSLSDVLISYIGHHASPVTIKRIKDFLKYRESRAVEIKKYTS